MGSLHESCEGRSDRGLDEVKDAVQRLTEEIVSALHAPSEALCQTRTGSFLPLRGPSRGM
jgi:hypothetical protein